MEDWRVWAGNTGCDPQFLPGRNGSGLQDVEEDFPGLLTKPLPRLGGYDGF